MRCISGCVGKRWTTDCILDACVTDTNARSCCKRDPVKGLESQEKEKKRKCLEECLERRPRHFNPSNCSVDGMLGREAKTFAKRLAAKFANRREKSYSQVCGCVNARLSGHCSRHAPVHERKQSPSAQNQRLLSPMRRLSWPVTV